MKKTIALLLALLLVAGTVFAEVIDITAEHDPYNMHLKAVVPEGGGLDNGDGSDPDDLVNGGLYVMVGYNRTDKDYGTSGAVYNTGELENLGTFTATSPLSVSLTPDNDADTEGSLQFYVAAMCNSSTEKTTTVAFSCTDGFMKNEVSAGIPITFKGIGTAYKNEGTGLSASYGDNGAITVTAAANSYQPNYIYVAHTEASWIKDASYKAGTYTATITVTVSTGA